MKLSPAKKTALYGIMVALAFALSYLEHLVPIPIGVPGIKPGFANLVVVVALYVLSPLQAAPIAAARILLAGLTFGNAYSLLYSFAGGALSFLMMCAAKKSPLSPAGVSVVGGISHNVGQILVAAAVMRTGRIVWYLPVLLIAGVVTGLVNGMIARPVIRRLKGASRS